MARYEKLVIVTRETALEGLERRLNTRAQARFYIEHMGGSFDEYSSAHDTFQRSLESLKKAIPQGVRGQWIDRSFLPTFTFGDDDLVVTLGPDGLVVNTAKYLNGQPLLALNPDPARIDGVLVPFSIDDAAEALEQALACALGGRQVTMAKATLNDGLSLLAVNDLFIGQRTHVSARYRICYAGREENQSSSGIIVSTGAGSTGWLRSVLTGATRISCAFNGEKVPALPEGYRIPWEARHLLFTVREPFISKVSGAEIVGGAVDAKQTLQIVSQMPQNGVIFSDGVEEDFIPFNSGAIAQIGLAEKTLNLVVPDTGETRADWKVAGWQEWALRSPRARAKRAHP